MKKGEIILRILDLALFDVMSLNDVEYYLNTLTKDELHNIWLRFLVDENKQKDNLEYEIAMYFNDDRGANIYHV